MFEFAMGFETAVERHGNILNMAVMMGISALLTHKDFFLIDKFTAVLVEFDIFLCWRRVTCVNFSGLVVSSFFCY